MAGTPNVYYMTNFFVNEAACQRDQYNIDPMSSQVRVLPELERTTVWQILLHSKCSFSSFFSLYCLLFPGFFLLSWLLLES